MTAGGVAQRPCRRPGASPGFLPPVTPGNPAGGPTPSFSPSPSTPVPGTAGVSSALRTPHPCDSGSQIRWDRFPSGRHRGGPAPPRLCRQGGILYQRRCPPAAGQCFRAVLTGALERVYPQATHWRCGGPSRHRGGTSAARPGTGASPRVCPSPRPRLPSLGPRASRPPLRTPHGSGSRSQVRWDRPSLLNRVPVGLGREKAQRAQRMPAFLRLLCLFAAMEMRSSPSAGGGGPPHLQAPATPRARDAGNPACASSRPGLPLGPQASRPRPSPHCGLRTAPAGGPKSVGTIPALSPFPHRPSLPVSPPRSRLRAPSFPPLAGRKSTRKTADRQGKPGWGFWQGGGGEDRTLLRQPRGKSYRLALALDGFSVAQKRV